MGCRAPWDSAGFRDSVLRALIILILPSILAIEVRLVRRVYVNGVGGETLSHIER